MFKSFSELLIRSFSSLLTLISFPKFYCTVLHFLQNSQKNLRVPCFYRCLIFKVHHCPERLLRVSLADSSAILPQPSSFVNTFFKLFLLFYSTFSSLPCVSQSSFHNNLPISCIFFSELYSISVLHHHFTPF